MTAACVVVVGDIGRSPRSRYHATSLAKCGYNVSVVGYIETTPDDVYLSSERITTCPLTPIPRCVFGMPGFLRYLAKFVWVALSLATALWSIDRPNYILLQNPPGVPALAVVWLFSKFCGSTFIVDWHNYGFSILALSGNRCLSAITRWFERIFGCCANHHLCVSNAMKSDLAAKWGISAVTHYDRPPTMFRPVSLTESHALFEKMAEVYPKEFGRESDIDDNEISNRLTVQSKSAGADIELRSDRPAIIVTSTSWTEDERMEVLFDALSGYDRLAVTNPNLPSILCLITGKGPLKQTVCEQQKSTVEAWRRVKLCTPWLEPEDYPTMLASAELGISLHISSSGLDLPMKVVDMFGCGLPVAAIHFECLHELVKDGENGTIFHDSSELCHQLTELFETFPSNVTLNRFRKNLESFRSNDWHTTWLQNVHPLFNLWFGPYLINFAMVSLRPFTIQDLWKISHVNLDPLTETYGLSFYMQYLIHWPELFICAEAADGQIIGYIMGKIEGYEQNSTLHGHVTALSIAPTHRRMGLAKLLMARLEEISEKSPGEFLFRPS